MSKDKSKLPASYRTQKCCANCAKCFLIDGFSLCTADGVKKPAGDHLYVGVELWKWWCGREVDETGICDEYSEAQKTC